MGKKKDTAELRRREAELEAALAKKASKKDKRTPADVDLSGLKPKALRSLVADKSNGKPLRLAAKAELERRDNVDTANAVLQASTASEPEKAKPGKKVKPERPAGPLSAEERAALSPGAQAVVDAADEAMAGAAANAEKQTAAIKARVEAKKARRAELASDDYRAAVDRADDEAVRAYNDEAALLGLGSFLTSDAEREALADAGVTDASEPGEPVKPKRKPKPRAPLGDPDDPEDDDPAPQVVEPIETETGTVYAAGEASDEPFGKPSEAPAVDYEVNGLGQYKVKRPSDGKLVGYTRVTTFIDTNESKGMLEAWKMRVLLEGVAVAETPDGERMPEPVSARVRDLVHVRDTAIAKARKADKKGKLAAGQLGTIVDGAWADFKRALNDLAEHLLEVGGAHEKAAKGTSLHALCEVYDREGIDAVGDMLTAGLITPADLADVEAYGRALEAAGVKVLPEYIEQPVVIHEEKIAGRLDRIVLAKLPGAQRATRMVLDVKSGRIDFGAGKIAQQLEKYAKGTPYDLDTHETLPPHGASRTKALVLHLPAGSGEAAIYVVDLSVGRVGNDLSAKVRAFRNDGKRAIDTKVDLTKPAVTE